MLAELPFIPLKFKKTFLINMKNPFPILMMTFIWFLFWASQSLVVLNLENQFTTDDSLNTAEDLTEEDLDSMLEECSTLYEAVSTCM